VLSGSEILRIFAILQSSLKLEDQINHSFLYCGADGYTSFETRLVTLEMVEKCLFVSLSKTRIPSKLKLRTSLPFPSAQTLIIVSVEDSGNIVPLLNDVGFTNDMILII